jgi:hypothetical protein
MFRQNEFQEVSSMKCTACGGEGMVEGVLFDKAYVSEIGFKASDSSVWRRMFGIGVMPVSAFACARCGHLQLGVSLSEEMRQEHLRFDEPPPSVTA